MAKKNKKGSRAKTAEEQEFNLPKGLELLEKDGWAHKVTQWLKNNFSAIILPIIALIILGGGIYLYSQQKNNNLQINQNDMQSGTLVNLDNQQATSTVATSSTTTALQVQTQKPQNSTENKKEKEVLQNEAQPQTSTQASLKNVYSETAQKGDGITHLARRALKEYLQANHLKMSPEQKVYMEDYLQNHTGNRMLMVGEKISFSRSLIEEAISHAQHLTQNQLRNLHHYSQLVPSLNY